MIDAVHPLTPARWKDLENLFGPRGAATGCWCMYWRWPRAQWDASRGEDAKSAFKKRVKEGAPPGVLAYAGDEAMGWLQIGPRLDAPQWNRAKRVSAPMDDAPPTDERVWAATCFFVRRTWRGKGVTAALLKGGIEFARNNGARIIEACPHDGEGKADPGALYVGQMRVFARAGFKEAARRKENRPLMRLELKKRRG